MNQSCSAQATQVFGNGGLTDGERLQQLGHRFFAVVGETPQQGAPGLIRNGEEDVGLWRCGRHGKFI
jgi:hypothetical protein